MSHIRSLADFMASVVVLPCWVFYLFLRLLIGRISACQAIGQRAARWPGEGGNCMRRALYSKILKHVGHDVVISYGTLISKDSTELGDHVYIGAYSVLGSVRVGAHTMIADHTCIPSGARQHGTARLDIPMAEQRKEFRTISIGTDSWIGSGSIILADVGDHCIIGAGSVVTKPIPDYAIAVGNPARPIGDRRQAIDGVAVQVESGSRAS